MGEPFSSNRVNFRRRSGWIPEETSSDQPLQVWLREFEWRERVSMSLMALIRVTLNAGLMKPRKGFTLVAGKKKLGEDKIFSF
jgi:hypothetical protein